MQLAIGDVVRDRGDMTLGTVAGVTNQSSGNLVALQISGGSVRLAEPYDLVIVARHSTAMTAGQSAIALIVFFCALAAAVMGCWAAQQSGAGWPLMLLASFGSYAAVQSGFRWWLRLTGPPRFRV